MFLNRMRVMLAIVLLLFVANLTFAEEYSKIYTVSPGGNGEHMLAYEVNPGDIIKVTFKPTEGYELVSSSCSDNAHLGWGPNGNVRHSFAV